MQCINTSHPQFKNLLEQTGLHPDVLKAKVSIWIESNNSDSFPTTEQLQLGVVLPSQKATDPINDWLAEFEVVEEPVVVSAKKELITDVYGKEAEWDEPTDNHQTTIVDDQNLFMLMNNPNISILPENKRKLDILSKVVGKKEAYRDYFEQNGNVRPGSTVLDKLDERYSEVEDVSLDEDTEQVDITEEDFIKDFEKIVQSENSKKAITRIEQLSAQLNIDAEVISAEDVLNRFGITKPGVKGFFKNGKVYLVEGAFDQFTVFHEFSHAVIKSLAKDNPALFLSLYEQVLKTPEGQQIFKALTGETSDYEVNSPEFMEEVIVTALDEKNQVPKTVVQNILFHIKQFLRKMLGKKINISKLDSNTSLSDMLNMINEGGEFILDKDFLNKDDMVMFLREYQNEVDQIESDSAKATQIIVNEMSDMVAEQLGNLLKSESVYQYLKDELSTENYDGELQKLKKMLDAIATTDKTKMANLPLSKIQLADVELFQDKLNAFVGSLVQADKVLDKFEKKLTDLENNNVTTNEDFDALFALETFVDDWKTYVAGLQNRTASLQVESVTDEQINIPVGYTDSNTPIGKIISALGTKLSDISSRTNTLKVDSTVELLYTRLYDAYANIRDTALADMAALKKAGRLSQYDDMHEEYYGLTLAETDELAFLKTQPRTEENKIRITILTEKSYDGKEIKREGLKALLKNQLADSMWMNGMYESYLLNQDKIVSGFANYVNDFLLDVNGNASAIESDFLEGLKPLLAKAGFDNTFFGERGLGNAIQHNNVSFEYDDFGNVVQFDEYAIASNFTGHEFELAKLRADVLKTKKLWQDTALDSDYDIYLQAEIAYEDFLNAYMTRENVPEYYEADKLFRTPAGLMAKQRKEDIFAEMRLLKDNFTKDPTDYTITAAIKKLWFDYQQLQSEFDLNGNKKTGDDLAIAQVLIDYREATKDFHEYTEIPGMFEQELEEFEDYLINVKNETRGSDSFEQKRNDWIVYNTSVELVDDYYETGKILAEEKKSILQPLLDANLAIADTSPMYQQIYAMLKKTKDDNGEYNGTALTNAEQAKIKELHEQIIAAEEDLYTVSGLTKLEIRHFNELIDQYDYYNKFRTKQDEIDHKDYSDRMKDGLGRFGITADQLMRVREIDKELRGRVTSESTDVYISSLLDLVGDGEAFDILTKFVYDADEGTDLEGGDPLTHAHISLLLENMDVVSEMIANNPALSEWFNRNHYTTFIPYRDEQGLVDGEKEIWRKTAAWQFTRPSDPLSYKKKLMYSKTTGALIGFLEVDGVFRVPNISFKQQSVKDAYKTEIVERDYIDASGELVLANIDNRGLLLPRADVADQRFIDSNYRKMFDTNRDLFNLMLYVKNQYLDNQKGLDNSQKRYLTYPSVRMSKLENVSTPVAFWKRIWESISSVWQSRTDDFEEGLNAVTDGPTNRYTTLTRPITGNYKIAKHFVSLNIIKSMGLQLYSIEHYKALRKANSVAQMLQSSVENFGIAPAVQGVRNKIRTTLRFTEKSNTQRSNRLKQIDAIIDKHFRGKQFVMSNSKTLRIANHLINKSATLVAFKSFAVNFTSSFTNFFSGEAQLIIKAASDPNILTMRSYAAAARPATKAMAKIVRTSFSNRQKDAELQFIHIMDAIPDTYKKRIGDRGSRTMIQSGAKLELAFTDRRTLQDGMALHQFYGIILNNKFKLNGKTVSMLKAIELVNGRVQTKAGVPEEFQITYDANGKIVLGSKIKEMMKKHQGVLLKTIGQANEFSQPEVSRYLLGKFQMFLLRFYPAMAVDRWQIGTKKGSVKKALRGRFSKRVNLHTERAEIGMVVGALESVRMMSKTLSFKALPYANKVALIGSIATVIMKIALDLYLRYGIRFNTDDDDPSPEFGWDPEDEKIFKKLEHASGVPNAPFIADKYTASHGHEVQLKDYAKLQLLRVGLRAQREFRGFEPSNMFVTLSNLATFHTPLQEGGLMEIMDMVNLGLDAASGDGDVYDKEANPTDFGQKGELKIINGVMKYIVTGKQAAPAFGIKMDAMGAKRAGQK